MFYVYCFDSEGRYGSPEVYKEPAKAVAAAISRKDSYPRVIITDRDDYCNLEIIDGKVVFPTQEQSSPSTFLDRFKEEFGLM